MMPAAAWRTALGAILVLTAVRSEAAPGAGSTVPSAASRTQVARPDIRHDLTVAFDPAAHRIESEDAVTFPSPAGSPVRFLLHAGLEPRSATPGITLARLTREPRPDDFGPGEPPLDLEGAAPVELWEIRARRPLGAVTLRFAGIIHHPVEAEAGEVARGFSETPGTIDGEGIFLSGSTFWVPWFGEARGLVSFSIEAKLPAGWSGVSAADAPEAPDGSTGVRAVCDQPQEDITFVAGRFTRYERRDGRVRAEAYLRAPDPTLAAKYLEATGRYLTMYERLFGPYPFAKFALVENFWETGYGFASFTLLGPKVIRFPFILTSSYPHEILHDWWGNGVFVDRSTGNWCEGLTAYLADHLFAEQQGRAAEFRQGTLQGWADYAREGRDFPLTQFRERHSAATEAVGYGKSLLFFHDVRRRIGDEAFTRGLAAFFEEQLFRRAGFRDLRSAFEAASGTSLGGVFGQAVERPGAPSLSVSNAAAIQGGGSGWGLRGVLTQTGVDPPWDLLVPVAVTMEGKKDAWQGDVRMNSASQPFELELPARPVRLDIDPEFDLFRRLDPRETPPAFSSLFGAKRPLIVLPSRAPAPLLAAYREAARSWASEGQDEKSAGALEAGGSEAAEIRTDAEIASLPADRSVWIFGWENGLLAASAPLFEKAGATLTPSGWAIGDGHWDRTGRCVAMAVRADATGDRAIGLLAADGAAAIPGLARKLPHYHRYGWLVFEGDEPSIAAKGKWTADDSPLTVLIVAAAAGTVNRAALASREALAELPPAFSAERMMATVTVLAGNDMKGRGLGTPELDRAADLIAAGFAEAGLEPSVGSFFQDFELPEGGPAPPGAVSRRVRNVVGMIRGSDPARAGESVVVAAHYDHLGLGWPDVKAGNAGRLHPGADDNASGVAVLIELARALAGSSPRRTIVFAAFSGEEAGLIGSREFVRKAGEAGTKCRSMVNLDTVGRLGTGKLLILGADSATEWPHIFQGASYVTGVPVEIVAGDPGGSDQVSFRYAGVPSVQLFTGAHADYHTPSDTADRVDGPGLVRVAAVLKEAVDYLAERPEPLTAAASAPGGPAPVSGRPERRASLGTLPDYSFAGPGVKITGTTPGSPAEAAGLLAGDVLLTLDGAEIAGLRSYSGLLASHSPGDRVKLTILRGAETLHFEVTLAAR